MNLPENRQVIEQRLQGFIQFLQKDLPIRYDVELRGSWQTLEYHATLYPEGIVSFSDIDFVSTGISISRRNDIATATHTAAALAGVVISGGVSLRDRTEINSMWSLHSQIGSINTEADAERFVCFWSLIGIAETCMPPPHNVRFDLWHKYQLTKFFLRLWRTLAITRGLSVQSWEEALSFSNNELPYELRCSTLRIKLGSVEEDNWDIFVDTHIRALLKYIPMVVRAPANNWLLERMMRHLIQCEPQNQALCFREALLLAERFEAQLPNRQAARHHLMMKTNYS